MNTDEDLIRAGMDEALKRARQGKLDVSRHVSHSSDLRRFYLTFTDLEIAEVVIEDRSVCPSKVIEKKRFPFKELFNSHIAIKYGKKLLQAKMTSSPHLRAGFPLGLMKSRVAHFEVCRVCPGFRCSVQ